MLIETSKGRQIFLIPTENNLCDPKIQPSWTRAQCPIHSGDHQRSLSINKASGWGQCSQCHALVLLEEYNQKTANDLRQKYIVQFNNPAEHINPYFDRDAPHTSLKRDTGSATNEPKEATYGESWQHKELQALHLLYPWLQQALKNVEVGDSWQAQAYLAGRSIPLDIALHEGIGYLPRELLHDHPDFQQYQCLLDRWTERIIIPLRSPDGNGYMGRTIWRWQIGMNEEEYKGLLADECDAPKRSIQTNPAGWFCAPPIEWSDCVALVEGPFDRLAAIAAGMKPTDVHALIGTTCNVDWIPEHIAAIILAFNPDPAKKEAIEHTAEELLLSKEVLIETILPQDDLIKNWSARWATYGYSGIASLLDTFTRIQGTYTTSMSFRYQH